MEQDDAVGWGDDVALWRVRLYENGPVDVAKCSAGVWSADTERRAVFCQCSTKRLEGNAFCRLHFDPKKRKHGVWNVETAGLKV